MLRLFGVLGAFAFSLSACEASSVVTRDINSETLSWNWTQGSSGPVGYFRVECKTSTGDPVKPHDVDNPTARSVPVKDVIPGPGNYSCVIRAVNDAGPSLPSNEVHFTVAGSAAGSSG